MTANTTATPGDSTYLLFAEPPIIYLIIGALGILLLFSLSWNIFCCVSRCSSGKCQGRNKQRHGSRQMEDNPIYGNINYMQTSMTLFTEADPSHSRDQHRANYASQPKTQDCYANLTLKAPRVQSGRSSPQIQYSDVVHLEETAESEKEDEGNTVSDLYASVQNQRTKIVDTADTGEGYANHL